jgi:CheY-like chemotaxis protein
VVVADDVVEIQQLLEHWLREIGCEVMCVSTGREAVRLLRSRHVDVVITDVLMPDGDGLEVISEMKRTQPWARVLAISGGGHHLQAADCLKFAQGFGAQALLLKPFDRQDFLDALTLVLPADAVSTRTSGAAR